MHPLALTALVAASLVACSGGGSQPTPVIPVTDLTGNWTGLWVSTPLASGGTVNAVLVQDDLGQITGQVTLGGSPCFSTLSVGGRYLALNRVELQLSNASGLAARVFLTLTAGGLDGTYESFVGVCAGDFGTFVVTPN